MRNTEMSTDKYVLFSIPIEVLEEAGIGEESVIQMSAGSGKIIISAVTDTDGFVCDGDCENCPVSETDCDGNCESCPCCDRCDEREAG